MPMHSACLEWGEVRSGVGFRDTTGEGRSPVLLRPVDVWEFTPSPGTQRYSLSFEIRVSPFALLSSSYTDHSIRDSEKIGKKIGKYYVYNSYFLRSSSVTRK